MTHPAALPHDPPKQIGEDLFVVHGSVQIIPVAKLTRNMTIVRNQGELTLINAVRLDEPGLESLEALGEVKHVLRLGPMHGMDDDFYVDRYNAEFWSFEGGTTYTTPNITRRLVEDRELPFPKAKLFAFKHMTEPEGAILLERSPGVLLTCDAIQSYSTAPHMPHTAWLMQKLLPLLGFPSKTIIGPIWVKKLTTDREGIKSEFERLMKLDFDQLLAGHGTFLERNAHKELEQAFEKMFS
ncbi:MAG: hypothetical protein AB8B86_19405 [Pseudomonadales bacterium]